MRLSSLYCTQHTAHMARNSARNTVSESCQLALALQAFCKEATNQANKRAVSEWEREWAYECGYLPMTSASKEHSA